MTTPPQRIGWIGTGVMGLPMASHLLESGLNMTVFTRSRAKAQPLLDAGAQWAGSPAEAADGRDIVISIVGFPKEVAAVHLEPGGTLSAATPPKAIIDMTTSQPGLAVRIAAKAGGMGVRALDAPVSGGDVGARQATLSIMVGGSEEGFAYVRPVLDLLGKTVVHQGAPGAGQRTKAVNQVLIASNMIGVCEGMLLARSAGLDPLLVLASVAGGAAGSWSLSNLAPRMIDRDFEPGFFVEHFIKDLEIALQIAARTGLALPGLALARQLYEATKAQGYGRKGTQALLLALEHLSAVEDPAAPNSGAVEIQRPTGPLDA